MQAEGGTTMSTTSHLRENLQRLAHCWRKQQGRKNLQGEHGLGKSSAVSIPRDSNSNMSVCG